MAGYLRRAFQKAQREMGFAGSREDFPDWAVQLPVEQQVQLGLLRESVPTGPVAAPASDARVQPRTRPAYLIDSKAPTELGRQLSPLNARLSDGRTIETAYQQAKGYPSWREGKGRPALLPDFDYEGVYQGLYRQFADENPALMNELALVAREADLVHPRARTTQNPATALMQIIREREKDYPDLASQFYAARAGQHRPALFFERLSPATAGDGAAMAPEQPAAQLKPTGQQLPSPPGDDTLPPKRMASSPGFREKLRDQYLQLPEFLREDLLEGLLVGGGIALPVAMMPNQDPEERVAAVLGGIGAATFGGALSRRLGARIGSALHSGELESGSYAYNLGRNIGQKEAMDAVMDMAGAVPVPKITGAEVGRAVGRAVGDEVFGVAGTIGALGLAQAMDATPDPLPQPTVGEVAAGTVPGAVIGLAASGLLGGAVDLMAINRAANDPDATSASMLEALREGSVFSRRKPAR